MSTADAYTNSRLAPFTCIWKIENFSELTYIDLRSPQFVTKSMGDTVWCLQIHIYAGFFCFIETGNFSEEENKEIDIEFSLLGVDGTPLISKKSNGPRLFISQLSCPNFWKRWTEFIPNNTLTVQCRMWRKERENPNIDLCYILTKLKIHKETFVWAVKEFSKLNSTATRVGDFREVALNQSKVYPLKPLTRKGPFMSLILYLVRNSKSDDIYVDFLIEKGKNYTISCELDVLNANGNAIANKRSKCHLYYSWALLKLRPLISKAKLIRKNNLFLPNDTLLLRCSFEICAGVISNKIEHFTPNVYLIAEEAKESQTNRIAKAEADKSLEFGEYLVKEVD